MSHTEPPSRADQIHSLLDAISNKLVGLPDVLKGQIEDDLQAIRSRVVDEAPSAGAARYKELAESIHDGFFELNRDWRFSYVNQRAASNVGYTPDELIGKNIWETFPQVLGTQHETVYRKVMEQRHPASFKTTGAFTNKSYDIRVYPSTNGITAFWIDMTEQKQAEAAQTESEQKFARIFEKSTFPSLLGSWPDAAILDVNEAWVKVFGYTRQEAIGKTTPELNLNLDPELRKRMLAELQQNGFVHDLEMTLRTKTGELRVMRINFDLIEINGKTYSLNTAQDITEQKRVVEALHDSVMIYRAIGEAIDYGIWICAPDGRNLYASQSYLDLVGITQQQCSEFGWGDTLHPDDAERTIAAWKECVRTGGVWDIEHRFRGKDGQYHPILARGIPVRNEAGEIICWAGINLDISRLKEAEQARLANELQIELQRRLLGQREEERQAIARELHDGPVQDLSGLLFNIQFAKGAFSDLAMQVELENIGNGLRATIQDIRNLINEMRPPSLIRFGLSKTIEVYLDEFRDKHPDLKVNQTLMDDNNCITEQARISLFRILQEALNNTLKHAGASMVDVILLCEDHQATLEIRDNGKGFSVSNNLAEYNAQGHFGLLGMKERAAAVNGEFRILSSPGMGTTIKITVPVINK